MNCGERGVGVGCDTDAAGVMMGCCCWVQSATVALGVISGLLVIMLIIACCYVQQRKNAARRDSIQRPLTGI